MDFRRIPFQFSSTDPAKRQAELQKRFGLPVNSEKEKMHIDFNDPAGLMGIQPDGMGSATISPRPQHRVPIFKEGSPEPMKSAIDSQGSPVPGRKPHVRVVPIEIEGEDNVPKRHRNLSGPTSKTHFRNGFYPTEPSFRNGFSWLPDDVATTKPPVVDLKPNPRERTIPIKIDCAKKAKTLPVRKPPSPLKKEAVPKMNGCAPSKVEVAPPKVDNAPSEPQKPQLSGIGLSKKKIEGVLEKLKGYHAEVEKFTGTVKEKPYKYLDEMLTRLMLELDDVDTMGNEEVRLARKAAVRQVQASVDLLEAKVTRESAAELRPEVAAEDKDLEMEVSSSQDQNGEPVAEGNGELIADSTMAADLRQEDKKPKVNDAEIQNVAEPEEDQSQVVVEPVLKQVQDLEMDNEAEVKTLIEMPEEVSSEPLVEEKDKEGMEVDSEPIVTTSSPDEPACCKQNVVSAVVQIKEVDGESNDSEPVSTTNEPLVLLPDSPVKEQTKNLELDTVPEEPTLDESTKKLETEILSDSTKCIEELVTKSCNSDVSSEIVSNTYNSSIPNELSNNLHTDMF